MKINLPLKFCWLTSALLVACCVHSYASPLKNKGLSGNTIHAQAPIKGIVKDTTGETLVGVSVSIKGTTTGTQTDVNGAFTLDANPGDVLVFTYIGYLRQEVTVGSDTNITVTMKTASKQLTEVVVTALGIKRESKSLTYGVQTFKSSDLNNVPDPSLVNALSGKVAGAQINRSSSGVGGSTKVVLRGSKSINGDNNALYVIDGIPMPRNESSQIASVFGGQDRGDAIENLNADDIESISILPGSAAAALYGNQGANGVVLINTKKGIAGKTVVNFSSNTTFESPFELPKFQNTYSETLKDPNGNPVVNSPESWGDKLSTPASFNPKDFYNTGKTFINALSVQTGTQKNQSYFSFESTNSSGIIPDNKLDKYNFTARNTSQFFNDKLTLDVSANYINQVVHNRPNQGFYYNPIVPLYLFPPSMDINQYKNNFEVYDPSRLLNVQNWPFLNTVTDIASQNPYWIINRNTNQDRLSRFLGTVSLKYTINNWLNIAGRLKVDRQNDIYEAQNYASTTNVLVGSKGGYTYNPSNNNQTYADVIANINKKFGDFSLTANVGASLQNTESIGSNTSGNLLNFANVFSISNIDYTRVYPTQYDDRFQTQSLFGTASVGYKNILYFDVTGRNDWDSSLAFTNKDNFFYPSFGLNAILSQIVKLPDFWTFAKIRGNITNVGNGASSILYATNPTFPVNNGSVNAIGSQALLTLKPENTRSYEVGADLRFLNDNLAVTINAYKTFTKNQIYNVQVSPTTGFTNRYLNGGDVRNEGLEFTASYSAKFGDLVWKPSFNFSLNRSKVLDVLEFTDPVTGVQTNLDYVNLSSDVFNLRVQKGGAYGDIYAQVAQKDASGNYVLNGGQLSKTDNYEKIGNVNPNFIAGLQNEFSYKGVHLSFLIDGKWGGQVVSLTQAVLDQYGTSAATATARDNGGAVVNGTKVNAETYYKSIGGRSAIVPFYTYSATNIRLRELTVGYTFPGSLFDNKVKNIGVSAVARNLFFIKNNAPFDPDVTLSTGNGFQGLDIFNLPTVRSIGFKVSAQF
ncbi:SusC/RagA family TonB-linked outer membrane protein [Mucilaginibacter sp.]|uniref:SusC/RagA family TonB-linked outer membrane protein n=1 Tax=Mucilaginibacter sp. TaxID=1882438 RepID=UPI002603190B|nr:SusC/RagA family TonB-linked outer membrane protein [Mucilaginibacter sp.]MDB4922795.1 TonB-linked outer membrane protein SusC/RagA family [Mucilaginibacter sp.]